MRAGQEAEIAWQPDRVCRLKYLGGSEWEVVSAENSHTLQRGDRFYCSVFVKGETAYLDRLTRDGKEIGGVKTGIDNGISYAIVLT